MSNQPRLSIGLPVYNGEKSLRKMLDSILGQTYSSYKLIISDNASTDATQKICEEYLARDKRIRYVRQEKNRELLWNFTFVLNEAKSPYFVWAAHDDYWHPTFLEKNIKVLESEKKFVGSISRVKFVDAPKYSEINMPRVILNILKKITYRIVFHDHDSLLGHYEKKVRYFLKNVGPCDSITYGVYRTTELQTANISESFVGNNWTVSLNIFKHGDVNVVPEYLLIRSAKGYSDKGIINQARMFNKGTLGIVFPRLQFTGWCRKIFGWKIFLRNLDYIFLLNYNALCSQLIDVFRHLKRT